MSERKLNLELLRKVRNRIAEKPDGYDQGAFYAERSRKAPCGTVACLAGEILICSRDTEKEGLRLVYDILNGRGNYGSISQEVEKAMGVDMSRLFSQRASDWPAPFNEQFQRAITNTEQAKVAVAYLDECLKREAVMW